MVLFVGFRVFAERVVADKDGLAVWKLSVPDNNNCMGAKQEVLLGDLKLDHQGSKGSKGLFQFCFNPFFIIVFADDREPGIFHRVILG